MVQHRVENAQRYFFSGALAEEETLGQYMLPEVPEGYQMFETYISNHEATFVYVDENGNALRFEYLKKDTATSVVETFFITEDMQKKAASIAGTDADLYIDEEGKAGNVIVWQDEATGTLLAISAYLDEGTLIRLAESVQYQPRKNF